MISLHAWNLFVVALFFIYLLIKNLCPLYPFNDLQKKTSVHRKSELFYQYLPLLVIGCCLYINSPFTTKLAFIITIILFISHIFTWWFPYILGAHRVTKHEYEQLYSKTSKLLPPIRKNLVPDNQHLIVTLFLLLLLIHEFIIIF